MVRFGVLVGGVALVLLSCWGAWASSSTGEANSGVRLPKLASAEIVGAETNVPYGWQDFCRRYAGECDPPSGGEPLEIALSSEKWRTIDKINRMVNELIEPTSDMDHWGVVDQWDYPLDGKGDCEDYALLKRKLLIAAGFPSRSVLMTVVRDMEGDGHAILTVRTDRGDFVLDNLRMAVVPWNATGYRYVKRQSQEDPNVWLTLRGSDVQAVGAMR